MKSMPTTRSNMPCQVPSLFSSLPPLLFLRDLNLHMTTYLLFIRRLTFFDRTIILLDLTDDTRQTSPHQVSLSVILTSIEQLLISLQETQLVPLSHGSGTFLQSCLIKQMSHLVHHQPVIFIDPVYFLTFDSVPSQTWTSRPSNLCPQSSSCAFCVTDFSLTYSIERDTWNEHGHGCERRTHVFLFVDDGMGPVSFLADRLKNWGIGSDYAARLKHAPFLMTTKIQNYVLETLTRLEVATGTDEDGSVYF